MTRECAWCHVANVPDRDGALCDVCAERLRVRAELANIKAQLLRNPWRTIGEFAVGTIAVYVLWLVWSMR